MGSEKYTGIESLVNIDNGKILWESDPLCALSEFEFSSLQAGEKLDRVNLAGCSIHGGFVGGPVKNF